MDTSREYIKMCAAAEEIQKDWNIDFGSWIWHPKVKEPKVLSHYCLAIKSGDTATFAIPRTDRDDFLATKHSVELKIEFSEINFKLYPVPEWIWLPRQDQLQKMYKFDKEISPYKIIKVLGQIFEIGSEYYRHFNSMEQLWLAFIMHELYQKFWDGSGWTVEFLGFV